MIGLDLSTRRDVGVVTIGVPGRTPAATLYHGDAYAIRPTLGWMDCDCMDPPYEFRAEGGGHYRKSRTTMDRIIVAIDVAGRLELAKPLPGEKP